MPDRAAPDEKAAAAGKQNCECRILPSPACELLPTATRQPPPAACRPTGWFFVIAVIHTLNTKGDLRRAAEIAGTLHIRGMLDDGFQRIIGLTLVQVREALGADAYVAAWQPGEADPDFPALLQALLDEFDPE